MRVEVYRNLHRNCLSVRFRGRVIAHVDRIALRNVEFHVSQSGRERVLRERRKNVHAYLRGEWLGPFEMYSLPPSITGHADVRYDPYQYSQFHNLTTDRPVYTADMAWIANGRVTCYNPL